MYPLLPIVSSIIVGDKVAAKAAPFAFADLCARLGGNLHFGGRVGWFNGRIAHGLVATGLGGVGGIGFDGGAGFVHVWRVQHSVAQCGSIVFSKPKQ